jgi:hypothetical protein
MRNLLFWIVVANLFWNTTLANNNNSNSVSVNGRVISAVEVAQDFTEGMQGDLQQFIVKDDDDNIILVILD